MATSVAKITLGPRALFKSSSPSGNCSARARLSSLKKSGTAPGTQKTNFFGQLLTHGSCASQFLPAFLAGIHGFSQLAARPHGVHQRRRVTSGKVYAVAITQKVVEKYTLPTWAEFEMGHSTVFWETGTGEPPVGGSSLTIYFNPAASELEARTQYGIGFNGGFNQPIMCGGEPRIMTHKKRGIACNAFYSIKINVPEHALTLEFSFTDGTSWDGPYKIGFEVPTKWKNMPTVFFNEGLAETLSMEGACASAIFPEPTFVQDRCSFPANLVIEGGNRCELDWVPGCTDPENPFYNPLANVEDGSCPYLSDSDTEQ